MDITDDTSLISPCGMNCSICLAYLRKKNRCPGCRGSDTDKPVTRWKCKIKNCPTFQREIPQFCFYCRDFPCDKIKHLDKRYRTKYNMSMIENLEFIWKSGITEFLANERTRWTCFRCGGTICVHKGYCYTCGERNINM
ncbi:MAG: DUF3795 domain-containing protein [Methanomethylovorans sp.]|uniref:DUF3795 domain-containing protein n=1 Tax=Methanomethylovorans sp. TaxID=2758717 RepID=UPI0035316F39